MNLNFKTELAIESGKLFFNDQLTLCNKGLHDFSRSQVGPSVAQHFGKCIFWSVGFLHLKKMQRIKVSALFKVTDVVRALAL